MPTNDSNDNRQLDDSPFDGRDDRDAAYYREIRKLRNPVRRAWNRIVRGSGPLHEDLLDRILLGIAAAIHRLRVKWFGCASDGR